MNEWMNEWCLDEFFRPTSLDAVVFSHLAPLLKAPLPSAQLQQHLKACDNLCSFCSRIVQRYFPADPQGKISPKTVTKNYTDLHFILFE